MCGITYSGSPSPVRSIYPSIHPCRCRAGGRGRARAGGPRGGRAGPTRPAPWPPAWRRSRAPTAGSPGRGPARPASSGPAAALPAAPSSSSQRLAGPVSPGIAIPLPDAVGRAHLQDGEVGPRGVRGPHEGRRGTRTSTAAHAHTGEGGGGGRAGGGGRGSDLFALQHLLELPLDPLHRDVGHLRSGHPSPPPRRAQRAPPPLRWRTPGPTKMAPAPSMRERAATAPQEGPRQRGRSGTGAAVGPRGPWLDAAGGAAAASGLWAAASPLTPKEGCAAHLWRRRGSPRRPPTRPSRETPARAARPVTGRAGPWREREEAPLRQSPAAGGPRGTAEAVVSSWLQPGPAPAAG